MEPVRNLLQRGQVGSGGLGMLGPSGRLGTAGIAVCHCGVSSLAAVPPPTRLHVAKTCLQLTIHSSRAATSRPSAWASTRSGGSWSAWWTSARHAVVVRVRCMHLVVVHATCTCSLRL